MRYIKTPDEALEIMTPEERQKSCVITDPNQPDNPMVYVTPEFEAQTGYSREEALGRNCRFLQGADTDPITVGKIRNAVDRMLAIEVEILNYRKNGEPFWNTMSLRPVFSDVGKLTSFVAAQSIREIGEPLGSADPATTQIGGTLILHSHGSRQHGLNRLTRPRHRNRSSHP